MQEYLFPLTLLALGFGLIITGINIAKGSKRYAIKEDVDGGFKRIDAEIKDVNEKLNDKVSQSQLAEAIGGIKNDIKDTRSEIKEVAIKQDNSYEFIRELDKNVHGLKILLENFMKVKSE
jgi:septal ring factor EnvC (AmiA/AmiB activator)